MLTPDPINFWPNPWFSGSGKFISIPLPKWIFNAVFTVESPNFFLISGSKLLSAPHKLSLSFSANCAVVAKGVLGSLNDWYSLSVITSLTASFQYSSINVVSGSLIPK